MLTNQLSTAQYRILGFASCTNRFLARNIRAIFSLRSSVLSGLVGLLALFWLPSTYAESGFLDAIIPPKNLHEPRVLEGDGLLVKSEWLSERSLGLVTDIIRGPTQQAGMGVAGTAGAVFLKEDGSVLSRIIFTGGKRAGILGFFSTPLLQTHVDFVKLDGQECTGFLNRGGEGWQDSSFLDINGKTQWVCGGEPGVDDMAAGDLDRDGSVDFVVGFNGGGGVRRLDRDGKLQWQKEGGNVWHVEIVDTDGDGQSEIVHTSAGGDLTIRDAEGEILKNFDIGRYVSNFTICRWPTERHPPRLLFAEENRILLFDFDGKQLGELQAPDCPNRINTLRGVPVRLKSGEKEYLATVADGGLWNVSVFYLFNHRGELVYHEILKGRCGAVATVHSAFPGLEDLLVGGTGTVWRYTAANPKRAHVFRDFLGRFPIVFVLGVALSFFALPFLRRLNFAAADQPPKEQLKGIDLASLIVLVSGVAIWTWNSFPVNDIVTVDAAIFTTVSSLVATGWGLALTLAMSRARIVSPLRRCVVPLLITPIAASAPLRIWSDFSWIMQSYDYRPPLNVTPQICESTIWVVAYIACFPICAWVIRGASGNDGENGAGASETFEAP